jgi:lysophospholipase L1-like esterase
MYGMRFPRNCQIPFVLLLPLLFMACMKSKPHFQVAERIHDTVRVKIKISKPITGVAIGNSIIAGHPWRYSGLELGDLNYPDSFGQICYHLSELTNFSWFDRGWGGQTTGQIRKRFLRDALGDSVDPGDGRGPVTLSQKPDYVIIEGGLNDIAGSVTVDSIEASFAWMASMCEQDQIRCIALNCVGEGYGTFDVVRIGMIGQFNAWLASGALDSVGVTVVDINSLWNSGEYKGVSPYNNDNVHFSSLVDSVDGSHFTEAGYDSVAHVIFRVAGLSTL